ncbi:MULTISPECIES: FRG domain-containing protein [unclassified Nitrospina]|uniref:FRG domain-containing protein n=1 Tax=unclassified Nitrospina TaxID=2638683 RepID=UPI003F966395
MEIIELESWEEFEQAIEEEHNAITELKKDNPLHFSDLLFRGHADANWKLSTTLERFSKDKGLPPIWFWEEYFNVLRRILPAVSSLASQEYELPMDFKVNPINPFPLGYELMIYARHHGFPSPMLDWTRSPYVAAFFAFSSITDSSHVAIFSFREYVGAGKAYTTSSPAIKGLGPYVTAQKRHYLQQCLYTICHKDVEGAEVYCPHEDAQFGEDQDRLKKYTLPSTEREKVLRKLDFMNINAFSLFGSEEGLMDWLAYREIEKDYREG